jgi:hypothetical protein
MHVYGHLYTHLCVSACVIVCVRAFLCARVRVSAIWRLCFWPAPLASPFVAFIADLAFIAEFPF